MTDLIPANDMGARAGSKRRLVRKWLNRVTLGVAILAPLTFILSALGYKIGLMSLKLSLLTLTFKVGPLLLGLSLILAIASFIMAWIVQPRKGFVIAGVAALVAVFGSAKVAKTAKIGATLPVIHDITTDTQNPPVFGEVILAERSAEDGVNPVEYTGKKAPAKAADGSPTEKLVSALQTKAYPQIRPLVLSEQPDIVFGKALATAKSMKWKIKEEDLATGRIDATDTTFWYGFDDDVTVRLRASEGGGTIVDVRSLSRVGQSDLGANAARITAFLEQLAE